MEPLPVDSPDDVAALVELMQRPDTAIRGLGDHFAFLAGTRPDWFRPYQELVITELLDRFDVSFADQCLLLTGAPDRCVDHLLGRLRHRWSFGDAWTLFASVDEQGRYHSETVVFDEPPDPEEQQMYRSLGLAGGDLGAVQLKPYDADLVYCNGHIQLTPGVFGVAGGPPIGIYANPSCPSCGRLMFHVASVEHHIREYGDGWRSMFICEDCRVVSCNATGWN